MTTKFIGMKEFRQNLAHYTEAIRENGDVSYIILRKNVPVLKVSPVDEKEFVMEKLRQELDEAEASYRRGEYYTQEEIMKEFGLL
jgi:PHD/YefM family antitoxin component YafN of YafNO toxin-antitoxin module